MRKLIMAACICMLLAVLSGCTTTPNVNDNAYSLGVLSATAYYVEKDKFKPEQRIAIGQAWAAFDAVAKAGASGDVKGAVIAAIRDKVKDPQIQVLAVAIVEANWAQLCNGIDASKLTSTQLVQAILKYHDGIASIVSTQP